MTLPQNVKDAVQDMGSVGPHEEVFGDRVQGWLAVISAHLTSQAAEIARLREIIAQCAHEVGASISPACSVQFISDVPAEIRAVRRKDKSRLAAANALLRECHCYFEARSVDSRTIGEPLSLNEKIQSHLQGAGDEAAASPEFLCPCGSSLCNGEEDEA